MSCGCKSQSCNCGCVPCKCDFEVCPPLESQATGRKHVITDDHNCLAVLDNKPCSIVYDNGGTITAKDGSENDLICLCNLFTQLDGISDALVATTQGGCLLRHKPSLGLGQQIYVHDGGSGEWIPLTKGFNCFLEEDLEPFQDCCPQLAILEKSDCLEGPTLCLKKYCYEENQNGGLVYVAPFDEDCCVSLINLCDSEIVNEVDHLLGCADGGIVRLPGDGDDGDFPVICDGKIGFKPIGRTYWPEEQNDIFQIGAGIGPVNGTLDIPALTGNPDIPLDAYVVLRARVRVTMTITFPLISSIVTINGREIARAECSEQLFDFEGFSDADDDSGTIITQLDGAGLVTYSVTHTSSNGNLAGSSRRVDFDIDGYFAPPCDII